MKFKYGNYVEVKGDEFFNGTRGRVVDYYTNETFLGGGMDENYNTLPGQTVRTLLYVVRFDDDMKKEFTEDKLEFVGIHHSFATNYTLQPYYGGTIQQGPLVVPSKPEDVYQVTITNSPSYTAEQSYIIV